MYFRYMDCPLGKLLIAGDDGGLCHIRFPDRDSPAPAEPGWVETTTQLGEAVRQLSAYFEGKLRKFDLRLSPDGTTFQHSVWLALGEIPYGETISYGELARRIDRPKSARAVGAANGRNPLPIVIPCHRVIGGSGDLVGYGGGLDIKRTLLDLETM